MNRLTVFKNFLKDVKVGAVVPTSSFTVKRLCGRINFDEARVIVEYGPGTGVFSDFLLKRMSPDAKLILVDINPEFCKILRRINDPRVHVFHDSAENVGNMLATCGESAADCVISGIPFSILGEGLRDRVLKSTRDVLSPQGRLFVYQNSTFMRRHLKRHFGMITTDFVALNILPMFIFEVRPNLHS